LAGLTPTLPVRAAVHREPPMPTDSTARVCSCSTTVRGGMGATFVDGFGDAMLPRRLTTGEVGVLLASISSRHGWDRGCDEPAIEREWVNGRTGNRFAVVKCREEAARIFIKCLGPGNRPEHGSDVARALADHMDALADLLADRCPTYAMGPRQLGWLDDPPVVAAQFVGGIQLSDLIRQPDHELWATPELIRGWMVAAGAALAAFHDHAAASTSAGDPIADLETMLRRSRLSDARKAKLLRYADDAEVLAPRFGDFAFGNLIGLRDGRVAVLDPPTESDLAPRHRDIAHLTFLMHRNLAGVDPEVSRTRDSKRGTVLTQDFLAGYEAQSGVAVTARHGAALLTMYESMEALAKARRWASATGHPPVRRLRWRSLTWCTSFGISRRLATIRGLAVEH
jgi:hypothetical protein